MVIDSRAGRKVTPGTELVQDEEWDWIAAQARRPARHLLLASSVRFRAGSAFRRGADEVVTNGAWGRAMMKIGECLCRLAVMDHWASFQRSMRRTCELVDDIAHGREGEALIDRDGRLATSTTAISPRSAFRSAPMRAALVASRLLGVSQGARSAREGDAEARPHPAHRAARAAPSTAAGVPKLPFSWRIVERPDYANQVGTLTLIGPTSHVRVESVVDGEWQEPRLETAFERTLTR